jgi:hypothetical protein
MMEMEIPHVLDDGFDTASTRGGLPTTNGPALQNESVTNSNEKSIQNSNFLIDD